MQSKLVIGMDFGTDSARGILVNASTGEIVSSYISIYKRWSEGLYCRPEFDEYRQHPLDYVESIDEIFTNLFRNLDADTIKNIVAIGTNTTGSTPVAIDKEGQPLSLRSDFKNNPNAMFVLWKDHTAKKEADEINALAKKWSIDYTKYSGGIYSSEWFWSKILHINRADKKVFQEAFSWVEQSDWIPSHLIGINKASNIKRNRCAAGHKAMWNEEHGGLPSSEFLCALDSSFYHLQHRFYTETYTSDEVFGTISSYYSDKFGFNTDTIITVGAIDAHHGAVGAGISPYTLVKVIGTSTCDMIVIPKEDEPPLVPGICGQVDGSIYPGMIGFEAGQSAFGDIFNWYKKMLLKPVYALLKDSLSVSQLDILENEFFNYLTNEARSVKLKEDNLVFTDYFNGRRTPNADFTKQAASLGLTLSTDAGHIFKALVEATAFGSKAILDHFRSYNIPINNVIATGGIAKKSPYVMQVLADVLGCDILIVDSDQTGALGSAMFASVAAGIYSDINSVRAVMAAKISEKYTPNCDNNKIYQHLYSKYNKLNQI